MTTHQTRYKARMRAEGRCIDCGKPALDGKAYCAVHHEHRRQLARARNGHAGPVRLSLTEQEASWLGQMARGYHQTQSAAAKIAKALERYRGRSK